MMKSENSVTLFYARYHCPMEERFGTLEEAVEMMALIEKNGDGTLKKIVTPEREYNRDEVWKMISALWEKQDEES